VLRAAVLGLGLANAAGCEAFGSVDLGDNPAVRTTNLDADFFACRIQPEVLSAKGCATGLGGESCHLSESSYRLVAVDGDSISCDDGVPTFSSADPARVRGDVDANFSATEPWVFEDVESSPLLTRPTGIRSHPRVIFDIDSTEADLIREWVSVRR
jgi:hypothetical protein